ncbi:MAG: AI-2E family transporter [Nitrospirae bacterium]|nr:AI-2E family transporter [Nitrospirota bacterium]
MNNDEPKIYISTYEIVSWLVVTASLLLVLKFNLLPALLGGLLVFELIHILSQKIRFKGVSGRGSKLIVVALLAIVIIVAAFFLIFGTVSFFRGSAGNLPVLLQKMANIIENSLNSLPAWIVQYLPSDAEGFKTVTVEWLREHASELQMAGREAVRATVNILIGMVIGALIALDEVREVHEYGPLAQALISSVSKLDLSFRRIVFAQARISAINTIFAALYLAVVLPLFGVNLPLTKTLIALTFVAGLLPVIGNLISNTVVIVVSLSHSFNVTIASSIFLLVIHKLEYFLNARIIGSRIKSKAWEMLLAIIIMEAAFGMPGLIAAPIYYAYFKDELVSKNLI